MCLILVSSVVMNDTENYNTPYVVYKKLELNTESYFSCNSRQKKEKKDGDSIKNLSPCHLLHETASKRENLLFQTCNKVHVEVFSSLGIEF